MTTRTNVMPLPGQSGPMFTLINNDGTDLYATLMELNKLHADNEVRKSTGERLVSELEQIRDNIQDSGVCRRDMEEVEATTGTALESYPITGFTTRKSQTGVQVALEAISGGTIAIIAGSIVAGLAVLWKVIGWIRKKMTGDSGGSGGGGGGGGLKDTSSDEAAIRKDVENVEANAATNNQFAVTGSLNKEEQDKLNTDIAQYLDKRTMFVDGMIRQNNSYSSLFADFIPSFNRRFDAEGKVVAKTVDILEDLSHLDPDQISDKDIQKLKIYSEALDDTQFSNHKWPEFQKFMAACGVRSGGTQTIRNAATELFANFNKEMAKPSSMRADALRKNDFRQVTDDLKGVIRCLDDMEKASGGGPHNHYLSLEVVEAGLSEMTKSQDKLKSLGESINEKFGKSTSSSAVDALRLVLEIVNKSSTRMQLVMIPITINTKFGDVVNQFKSSCMGFSKKYVTVTSG